MKNTQLVGVILTILIIVGLGIYTYSDKKTSEEVVNTQVEVATTTKPTSLSDDAFKSVLEDPEAKILAKGDINGDGFEDAVLSEMYCGASCSTSLQAVLNENNKTAKLLKNKNNYDTFSPAYVGSSAAKSSVSEVKIENGIISLTGIGLQCTPAGSEEACTEEKWSVVKTVTYKFDGTNIVQLFVK